MDQNEHGCVKLLKEAISVGGPLSQVMPGNGFYLIWARIPKSPGLLLRDVTMPTGGPPATRCPLESVVEATSLIIMARHVILLMSRFDSVRRGGLMVNAFDSGSSGPGSSHGSSTDFLGKTFYSHGASPHPGLIINGYRRIICWR